MKSLWQRGEANRAAVEGTDSGMDIGQGVPLNCGLRRLEKKELQKKAIAMH